MVEVVTRLPVNKRGRDIVVGDIHGEFSSLERELQRVGFDRRSDRLICVGDLVDRGSESEEAAHWLKQRWFYSVLGNHDCSLILSSDRFPEWLKNRDDGCLAAHLCAEHNWFNALSDLHQDALLDALAELPLVIEIAVPGSAVGIVHASVPKGFDWQGFLRLVRGPSLSLCEMIPILWDREAVRNGIPVADVGPPAEHDPRSIDGVAHVIHGHTITPDRRIWRCGNRYVIETAGWLAAARPDLEARLASPSHWTLVDARFPHQPL